MHHKLHSNQKNLQKKPKIWTFLGVLKTEKVTVFFQTNLHQQSAFHGELKSIRVHRIYM